MLSSCFMRVLDGAVSETLYQPGAIEYCDDQGIAPRVAMHEGTTRNLQAGAYTYINDNIGLHRVGNPNRWKGAMSLHIYAPGWDTVPLFDEYVRPPPSDAGGAEFEVDGWGDF